MLDAERAQRQALHAVGTQMQQSLRFYIVWSLVPRSPLFDLLLPLYELQFCVLPI